MTKFSMIKKVEQYFDSPITWRAILPPSCPPHKKSSRLKRPLLADRVNTFKTFILHFSHYAVISGLIGTCPFCSKAMRKSNLSRHIRVQHTEDQPEMCEICNKVFKSIYNLWEHQRTKHGIFRAECSTWLSFNAWLEICGPCLHATCIQRKIKEWRGPVGCLQCSEKKWLKND